MSELVTTEQTTALATGATFDEQRQYLKHLIDSKALPKHINTVDIAFMIDQMGKELGFPTLQAFHYIIPITGKMTLSAKALGALMRKAGIKFTCTEDAMWIYGDGEAVLTPNRKDEKPIDRRTTIVFIRGDQKEVVSFYWSDAVAAGLTEKDNWKRMKREMMYARALSKGANRVAQDVTMGLYETGELLDYLPESETRNIRAKYNDEGGVEEVEYTNIK